MSTDGQDFQFQPGEHLLLRVSSPGLDLEPCEVVEQVGPLVTVRYQVYGNGPFYEKTLPWQSLSWRRDSVAGLRFSEWKKRTGFMWPHELPAAAP